MAKRLADVRRDSKDKGKQIFLVESSFRELSSGTLLSGDPQASTYERVEQVVTVGNRPPTSLFFSRYRRKNDGPSAPSRSGRDTHFIGVGTPSGTTTSGIPRRDNKAKYNFTKSNMVSALPAVDINRNERATPLDTGDKALVKADIIPNGNIAKVVTFKDAKPPQSESSRASASTEEITSSPSPSEASRSSRASNVRQSETTPSSRNSVLSLRRERPISGYSHLERTLEFGDANLLMERRRAMYALHVDKDSLLDKILDCECLEWNLNTAAILITVAVLGVVAVLVIYIIVQMVTKKTVQ